MNLQNTLNTLENHNNSLITNKNRKNEFKDDTKELQDILKHYNNSDNQKDISYFDCDNNDNSVNSITPLLAYNPLCVSTAPTSPSSFFLNNSFDIKASTPLSSITSNSSQSTSTQQLFNSCYSNNQTHFPMDSNYTSSLTPLSSASASKKNLYYNNMDKQFDSMSFSTSKMLPQSNKTCTYSKLITNSSEVIKNNSLSSLTTKYVVTN